MGCFQYAKPLWTNDAVNAAAAASSAQVKRGKGGPGDSDGKVVKVIRRRRSLTIITTAPVGQK